MRRSRGTCWYLGRSMRSGGRVVRAEPVFRKPLHSSTLTRWIGGCLFQHVPFMLVSETIIYLGSMVFTYSGKTGLSKCNESRQPSLPMWLWKLKNASVWRQQFMLSGHPKTKCEMACTWVRPLMLHTANIPFIYNIYLILVYFNVPQKRIMFAAKSCYTKGTHQGGEGVLWEAWRID